MAAKRVRKPRSRRRPAPSRTPGRPAGPGPGVAPASRGGTGALSLFRGVIRQEADTTVLRTGGFTAELFTSPERPRDDRALRAARARTAAAFRSRSNTSVLLRGRQEGAFILAAAPVRPLSGAFGLDAKSRKAFAKVRKTIETHAAKLWRIPGVIDVRPGYRFANGWITNEPCIVVTVRSKLERTRVPAQFRIPARLGGVRVDVAPATPVEQLLADQITAQAAGGARPGVSAFSDLALPGVESEPVSAAPPEGVSPEITRVSQYVPPSDATLDAVTGPMDLVCHASPDAGWPVLSQFLQETRERLTVAMYDFTAPHILKGVESAIGATVSPRAGLSLILDPGQTLGRSDDPNNPKANDYPEDTVKKDLADTLARQRKAFAFEWAAVARQGKTTGGIFPTAYHIKVAVRDGSALWLSSGNWQSSNQPDIDPLGPDAALPGVQTMYNREWHVVVQEAHPTLAPTYEKFIEWDIAQAKPFQTTPVREPMPELLVAAAPAALAAEKPQFFQPARITLAETDRVQPLLTPDNYADHVLPLISGARKSLYFQNQYIHIGKQNSDKFTALVDALRSKIDEGLDVRIILRDIGNTRQMLEALRADGFDLSRVRVQTGCHTKGIIVDHRTVLLGSHNWSNDGTEYNRDASLIFDNPQVVQYYEKIFLYDWANLAHQNVSAETAMPQIAAPGAPTPEDMVRIPWDAYFGDEDKARVTGVLDAARRAGALRPERPAPARVEPPSAGSGAGPAASGRTFALAAGDSSRLADLRAAKSELSARHLKPAPVGKFRSFAAVSGPAPDQNVVGVGVGEKISDGRGTGELAVKFLVKRKYAEAEISWDHLLPRAVSGLPVDVEEVGVFVPLVIPPNPRAQWRPAQPGCSVGFQYPAGSSNRMAGTFGAVVTDSAGRRYVLSNNHVLADEGSLKPGAPIFQAGLLDIAPTAGPSQIARLTKFIPLNRSGPSRVDCAIAMGLQPNLLATEILQIGAPQGIAPAQLDMIVHKFGRTTGYTVGRVTSVNTDIAIDYETGRYTFEEQITIVSVGNDPFSMAGDSGSLIVQRGPEQRAVGLLFAGSPTHTVANHIAEVLQRLGVNLA